MIKHVFLVIALLFSCEVLANDNLGGEVESSVLCQPQWPYTHDESVTYENSRIKALTYSHITCPIEINNDLRREDAFSELQVWVRVNNSNSSSRVRCRLKNFDWKGEQELNTPWVTTNGDGFANATLIIYSEYINRGGQTTMECEMPAFTYIENYQMMPRFSISRL